jgi:hypothetical protein
MNGSKIRHRQRQQLCPLVQLMMMVMIMRCDLVRYSISFEILRGFLFLLLFGLFAIIYESLAALWWLQRCYSSIDEDGKRSSNFLSLHPEPNHENEIV